MKLRNILKKEVKAKTAKVQQMDKTQLAKVIGGAETEPVVREKIVTINTSHVE